MEQGEPESRILVQCGVIDPRQARLELSRRSFVNLALRTLFVERKPFREGRQRPGELLNTFIDMPDTGVGRIDRYHLTSYYVETELFTVTHVTDTQDFAILPDRPDRHIGKFVGTEQQVLRREPIGDQERPCRWVCQDRNSSVVVLQVRITHDALIPHA